jgi:hypothetical protein
MIFVTAQPDVPYFHWQIMVYIHNFIEHGVSPNQIHILLGIVSEDGNPTEESLKLKDTGVNVHHYIDDRPQKHYIPTVKPFLISKWLKDFPEYGKCFFLHDSDIIFRKLPNFDSLINDDITYLSDTIGYIGYNYIMDCCNRYESAHPTSGKGQLLNEMANVIGVSVECIECNQENSGGGQYLIKNTDWLLWEKIYVDCVPLYDQMLDYQKRFPISPGEIQFWTAEMWSLLWNLWLYGIETRITPEFEFSWATDSIKIYEDKPILHMAGVTSNQKQDKFYKGDFININPLDKLKEDINFFDYVSSQSSTKKYVEVMKSLVKKQIKDYL